MVDDINNLHRLDSESDFEWKLRCCLAKKRRETDMDWVEIRDMLGLSITPDQLRKQAVGYEEYDNYINGYNGVATTILSISDLHVPFQLNYEVLEKYRNNMDILQINGDVVDCQALSKFPKQYRISPMEEMIQGRQYLIDLIKYINPKKVVCNYGNHDIRFANYFAKNIDTDILQLQPNTSLELIFEDGFRNYDKLNRTKTWYEPVTSVFEDTGIEVKFVDNWKVKIGKTWFVHPLAYRSNILATADKAKDYLQDTDRESFDCVVMAHTHSVGDSEKGYIRLIEQGAFCNVDKMRYSDGKLQKPQKKGFAIIAQDKNGSLIKDKTKVVVLD
ncbi:metallophosphoesterase [Longibaculum muris]|uniref:metallophosphoesterase n=1 Tax=Longibaculum muris TaxID=1796628 RepID=UPI0020579882|nr:MAG TPA: metallophosphatase domain protein [Caudoviricetes sp.]